MRKKLIKLTSLLVPLFAAFLVVPLKAQGYPAHYFPGDKDPLWTPLPQVLESEDPFAEELQHKLRRGAEMTKARGCVSTVKESSLSARLRNATVDQIVREAASAFEAVVAEVVPGISGNSPATLLVLDVKADLRGPDESTRRFYIHRAFDSDIPGIGHLCYQDGGPSVPPVGSTVFIARGKESATDGAWLAGSQADLVVSLGASDAVGPLHKGKFPQEVLRDDHSLRTWLTSALSEDER